MVDAFRGIDIKRQKQIEIIFRNEKRQLLAITEIMTSHIQGWPSGPQMVADPENRQSMVPILGQTLTYPKLIG